MVLVKLILGFFSKQLDLVFQRCANAFLESFGESGSLFFKLLCQVGNHLAVAFEKSAHDVFGMDNRDAAAAPMG
jgi:hypothetical protein